MLSVSLMNTPGHSFKAKFSHILPFRSFLLTTTPLPVHPFYQTCLLAFLCNLSPGETALTASQRIHVTALLQRHLAAILAEDIRHVDIIQGFFILSCSSAPRRAAEHSIIDPAQSINMATSMMDRMGMSIVLRQIDVGWWSQPWRSEQVELARMVNLHRCASHVEADKVCHHSILPSNISRSGE